jgi:hypothetical protein
MVVRPSRASVLLFKQIRLLHGEFVNNTPEIPCYARSLSSRLDSLFTINGGRPVQVEREREREIGFLHSTCRPHRDRLGVWLLDNLVD